MALEKRFSCFICGRKDSKLLLSLGDEELRSCDGCGLWFLWPQKKVAIDGDYDSVMDMAVYDQYIQAFRTGQYRSGLAGLKTMKAGRRILDIGCAGGLFLSEARKAGFRADGVEPQKSLAIQARKANPGSAVFQIDISNVGELSKKYDIVTLWSVFEHLQEPQKALIDLYKIIGTDGVLVIQTPNALGLVQWIGLLVYRLSFGRISGLIRGTLQLDFESKHWYLYSPGNLRRLLEKTGFSTEVVRFSSMVSFRHFDLWLLSRRKKLSYPARLLAKGLFFVDSTVGGFLGLGSDMVFFAWRK